MNCPVCKVELKMADRQGVEIDYCPQCRGVWLDRGELDKIIARSTALAFEEDTEYDWEDRKDRRHYGPEKRKRRSFLGEMFDVFD
jgi:Zn-finger nucleic acid-binding protein